jgi:pilus assembly protein CpaC
MATIKRNILIKSIPIAWVLSILIGAGMSSAGTHTVPVETKRVEIFSGKSIILQSDLPIKRISIANPEIADFLLISPKQVYLTGKTAGATNLTLWQNDHILAIYDLEVVYDISGLKQRMNKVLPEEKELQVLASNDSVTLAGKVTSATALSQAVNLAEAYAPEGKVQNLVQVGGVHQVMLEVRVSEISRSLTRRLGINLFYGRGSDFGVSTLGNLANLVQPINAELLTGPLTDPGVLPLGWQASQAVNAFFRFNSGTAQWTGLIDALKEDGLVKVLAEPTLITLSGKQANFLAGGEFPIPVPQGLGTVAIDYKEFGVGLSFTPTVLSKDKISIAVSPEVSELDFTTAVLLEGFVVPGIRTRRTSTTIELADGQSFAIAGLLRDSVRSVVQKYPLLGEIPVLGALFQSKQFQKEESELIIIVTPHLVKPLDVANQSLPTDSYTDPNDAEFYIGGMLEGKNHNLAAQESGSLDGEFGHELPE